MRRPNTQTGFSLVELMIVLAIFLVVSGAVFLVLDSIQAQYRSEQQFLDSFQGARIGIEQLIRDVHRAGFPAENAYDTVPAVPPSTWLPDGVPVNRIAVPLVGIVGTSVDQTCTVNGGLNPCTVPNPWEVVLETDVEPDGTVEWVYYRLGSPPGAGMQTLYRAVRDKNCTGPPWVPGQCVGGTPLADQGTPFVENLVQDPGLAVNASTNPAVFTYVCPGGSLAAPGTCNPEQVEEVYFILRARTPNPLEVRMVTLQGTARVLNPPQ